MPTSSPETSRTTRRTLIGAMLGLAALDARAGNGLPLSGRQSRFVWVEPAPSMQPLMLWDLKQRVAPLVPPKSGTLLVNVWATWCPACREELPSLAGALPVLARRGIEIAAISIDTKPTVAVAAYLQGLGATRLRAFHDPDGTLLSAERADGTSSPFQRWRMPLTFVIDQESHVRGYMPGRVDWLTGDGLAVLATLSASSHF